MKVIQNLRLTLFALFSIIAIGAFGQEFTLSNNQPITLNSNAGNYDALKVTRSDVEWTAEIDGNPDWISITSGASGDSSTEYPVTVKLNYDPNETADDRTADLVFKDAKGLELKRIKVT
ncbi:MAG: hypothetical protein K2M05_07885, partial [Paramuribaculum sp.]|nr:hypothetical protein [Paramuribaculum sp.]